MQENSSTKLGHVRAITGFGAFAGMIATYALLTRVWLSERGMDIWSFVPFVFIGCLCILCGWRIWVRFSNKAQGLFDLVPVVLAAIGAILWGSGGVLLGVVILSLLSR
jgi:hypothetical protein